MKTFKKKFIYLTQMEKEVYFLDRLSGYKQFPKIINIDKEGKELEMSFCGEVLQETSKPKLWKTQIEEIIKILEKENIYHNDMHQKNFVCLNDEVFLIDFGYASEDKEEFPYLNVSSCLVSGCDSFLYFLIKGEQNYRRRYQ